MDHVEGENSDSFCELCSLDFTTKRELEEHTWSLLHNTNLNRKKGRDCIHPCSLCKEQFTGLLEFTSHLHGDNHQEKIHQWRKAQPQEWSPDKQEPHGAEEQQLQSPYIKEEEDRPPSDWTADDFSGVRDFQDTGDQGGQPDMGDNRWGNKHGRVIPGLLGDMPPVRYPYPEPPDIRRGMLPPNQQWQNGTWPPNGEYYDRDFPNEGPPMHDRGPMEPQRVFRDGGWYNPPWPGMNDPRNVNRWPNERFPENRDMERYPYNNDNFPDNYPPGPRRRGSFEGDPENRPWNDGPRRDLREKISRRNENTSYNGRREMKSVVGSNFISTRENEGRPNSRSSRREGPANGSQRQERHEQRRRTSQENRRDPKERSQQKSGSSSESPSGKSGRKSSKPRKVTRSEERKDTSFNKDSAGKRSEVNELEKKKKEETTVVEKEKGGTKPSSESSPKSNASGDKNVMKKEKLNVESSDSKQETSKKPLTKSNSSSSIKGDSPSPKKNSSTSKGTSSLSSKGGSPKSSKDSSSSPKRKPSSPSTKQVSSSSAKGDSSSFAKGNSSLAKRRPSWLDNVASATSSKEDLPSSDKGNSSSSTKGDSSSLTKGESSSAKTKPSWLTNAGSTTSTKEDSTSSAKGNSFSSTKGDSPPSPKVNCSSSVKEKPPSSTNGSSPSSAKEDSPSSAKESSVKEKDSAKIASNKEQVSLSSVKDKDKSTDSSLNEKNAPSSNLKEALTSLPSREKTDVPVPKMGKDSSSSTQEKTDQVTSASYISKNTNSSVPGNETETTVINQAANVSSKSKQNDSITASTATASTVGSSLWGQREEKLRTLLGIKKEPKDNEENNQCTVSKSAEVTSESQPNRSVSSSSTSAVSSLPLGSSKTITSKYVAAAISQMSLSRPQCSFVHIDGVQCGAITWNTYCSYHQRVFQSEETNTHETGVVSGENQFARTESVESSDSHRRSIRTGSTQIFRPTTPPFDPPKRFGMDGRASVITDVKADHGRSSHDGKQEVQSDNIKDHKESSKEIDLSSTVSYSVLGAAGGPNRNIDLSTTRRLLFHGPSTDGSGSIDLSSTVSKPGETSRPHSTALDSTKASEGDIDLSGTVPDLEGLLALRGSSADKKSDAKFETSKTLLKHGRSSADSGPKINLGETVPYRTGTRYMVSSSVGSDDRPSIDLNDTVASHGKSVTSMDGAGFAPTGSQAASSSFASHSKGDFGHDVSQKRSLKPVLDRDSTSASPTPKVKTEMIDLNFSTKLLGVPHSVVTPFNTSISPPKVPTREMTKSPSEFSTKSSVPASPRSYTPQSPKTRRVSTSPMAGEQSVSPTISLSNLSLDLSRFNLPPAVRKALAERYSGKKVPSSTSAQPTDFPDGRRSQPLFTEHTTTDGRRSQPLFTEHTTTKGAVELGKKPSPLPARLRARGQRSISLDSPIAIRDNLHGEGSSRSLLLERGNIYDTNRFLSRPLRDTSEGHNQTGASALDRIPEGLFTRSNAPSANDPTQGNSNELQSRGLIDLSSTSYLQGISLPTEATRPTIDNSRSPSRPSVLQSRGLIDLNTTSPDFGVRGSSKESPEALVIKRKRVNSFEGSESSSNLGAEKVVKRQKQEELSAHDEKTVSYRPGINVQQLLTIEREEQEQLQNLHTVQSRLKSVRAHIQKLCTELDSLSSEEQRITLKMGELRNMRLSILESACYERQGQVTRVETVTRECSTSTIDDSKSSTVSRGPEKDDSFEYEHKKAESDYTRPSDTLNDISRATEKLNDFGSIDVEKMSTEVTLDESMASQGELCSSEEQNTSKSSDDSKSELRVSVGTATKFVLSKEVQEKLNVASKRSTHWRQSSDEADLNRGSKNVTQASRDQTSEKAPSKETSERIQAAHQDNDPSSLDGGSERCSVSAPVTCGGPSKQTPSESDEGNETRRNLMKKMKQMHSPDKAAFRKKSVSDVKVSKTLEAGRKKIQSARENLKRWKEQELVGEDVLVSNNDQKRKHSSTSSVEGVEIPSGSSSLDEAESAPLIVAVRDKTSSRKTTKELKKSSLFHSGKNSSKDAPARKNKAEKTNCKFKEKAKWIEAVPPKRRKMADTDSCSASSKGKTSTKGKGQIVSAAAHTTTIDLGGSGTEDRNSTEDEIPTRDVDSQSAPTSNTASRRGSHLQIPSSTVESLRNSMQNSREGRQHRGPAPTKFAGHTGAVCGLKVHNGHLFTCSADKTTRSFNIQTGQCVKVYQGHHQAVNCIEIEADKERLFTGSNDQTVRSYNIKSGVCTHRFNHDGRVMCIHYAFDLLFVGLSTGIVALINLLTNKCLDRIHCHEPRGVSCLTTATEGQRRLLCSGSFDSTIAIRDCKSGVLLRTFTDHNMTVLCLQVVENILYSGSADMKVQAHNLNSGELLRSYEGHTMSVSGLQVVGSVLVTSCLDKLIRCYDLATAELLQVYGGQIDMIFSVHVNSGRIYSGARDGSVVAAKLDLRVYHPCKWRGCTLNFGIVTHLRNHLREYHVMEQGTVEACHWADCGHQFSADDEISDVLKHVLGHVATRTARKSAS